MALIGRFEYPGLPAESVIAATYSLGHGVSPGVITVEVPALTAYPQPEGVGVFSYGSTVLPVVGCRFDLGTSRTGGGEIWTFSILDGRWPFEFGDISGHYNIRRPDGTIRPNTEKSPQELAKLCLKAMFISRFDISQLENLRRPEVHWSWANPAQALASLADECGCRVVYWVDRSISIVPTGYGANLPDLPSMSLDFSFDTSQIPSGVRVVGTDALYQSRWELEAVGLDTDGKWKPIDQLSYKPNGGWENEDPDKLSSVPERNDHDKDNPRALALQTVFKCYRIKKLKGSRKFKGIEGTVDDIKRCLPLSSGLVDLVTNDGAAEGGERKQKPPIVRGDFVDNEFTHDTVQNQQYKSQFSVDGPAGIFQFGRPVYLEQNGRYVPARLVAEIAFPIKSEENREPDRPTWRFPLTNRQGIGDKIIFAEDLRYVQKIEFDQNDSETGVWDNGERDELDRQAEELAKIYLKSLDTVQAGDRVYPGLWEIRPDGAIHQITWSVGKGPATTRAGRNTEHDADIVPPYKERRKAEKAKESAAFEKKVFSVLGKGGF